MAADSLHAYVLILPNPDYSTPQHLQEISRVKSSLTFGIDIKTNILTLYTADTSRGDDVSGLVYVPSISADDPCADLPILPTNITRRENLPNSNYDLVGFAPWVSKNCSLAFLQAAHDDPANVKGFVFFTTDVQAPMPSRDSDFWSGVPFKRFEFPVYAVAGSDGLPLMNKIAEYSGNMTDAWEARNLTMYYDYMDYARVFVQVNTGNRNPLPGLWLFLLIVLAVLAAIALLTSLSMHLILYRRRIGLRRRVARGEVDLEALGIKRVTVPRRILDTFPLRVYIPVPDSPRPTTPPAQPASPATPTHSPQTIPPTPSPPPPPEPAVTALDVHRGFSQSQCSICLDDFTAHSNVRELPCFHIFHPHCIDTFLSTQSSLCPLCKSSTLPRGYVPPNLTNATVRRERNIRRLRAYSDSRRAGTGIWGRICFWRRWLRGNGGGRGMLSQEDEEILERRRSKWSRALGIVFPGFG